MRQLILTLSCLFLTPIFFAACTTTPDVAIENKNFDNCICGPTVDEQGQGQCAIWSSAKTSGLALQVWQSEVSATCEAAQCSQFFSRSCKKIQMWPYPAMAQEPKQELCYCDRLLVENDKGQVQQLCAAWAEKSQYIIESYSIDDCSPVRCQSPPFQKSARICNFRFQSFYPSLLNQRK